MCGVFGYIGGGNGKLDVQKLQEIACVTESRGRHAFGFAWIDGRGRLKSFKQRGRVSDHLGLLRMAADARMLIGHCRYATDGDPANNINNHPHPSDGGWIVHNGMVRNWRTIVHDQELNLTSECDSEVLAQLVELGDGTLVDRCIDAVEQTTGPLVLLGLWKPGRIVAVKRGNPLHIGMTKGGLYLGSLSEGLPGKVKVAPEGEALELKVRSGRIDVTRHEVCTAAPLWA